MRRALIALLAATGCDGAGAGGGRCGPAAGVVTRVIDGDTVELTTGEVVRYLLVDTPESTSEVECFGLEAAELNRQLVEGEEVALAYEPGCTDRFDRLLAFVSVRGRDVNALLVERGFGCALFIPPDGEARADEFADLEAAARADGRGLWGACERVPCG